MITRASAPRSNLQNIRAGRSALTIIGIAAGIAGVFWMASGTFPFWNASDRPDLDQDSSIASLASPSRNERSAAPSFEDFSLKTSEQASRQIAITGNSVRVDPESISTELVPDSPDYIHQSAGLHLDSFTGNQPDLVGWSSVWQDLASQASLIEDSLVEEDGITKGIFRIPGSEVEVPFEIMEDGYVLQWNDRATTFTEGSLAFKSSISFERPEVGQISRMHGVVQLTPEIGHAFHLDGSVGHAFYLSDNGSNSKPLIPSFRSDGSYGITLGSYKDETASNVGYLDAAYAWYDLLSKFE